MRISDWSSDVCSSDLLLPLAFTVGGEVAVGALIGGTGRIIFSALHVAGTVIAYMTSLSFAQSVDPGQGGQSVTVRSEEHTSELQSLMRISYAVFCLNKKSQRLSCIGLI